MLKTAFQKQNINHLTCDDVTEIALVVVMAEEVGHAHHDQAQDGDEDAQPLAGLQATAQEGHRQQAREDDDRPTQHLEAGGACHVECWGGKAVEYIPLLYGGSNADSFPNNDYYHVITTSKTLHLTGRLWKSSLRLRRGTHLPTYMMEVAVMSHMAGAQKISGLKLRPGLTVGSGLRLS